MEAKQYMITKGDLLASARRLMEAGEISLEDYAGMLRRKREKEAEENEPRLLFR